MSAVIETIPEFFAGKNVFVTGGTGFLGKVLLEKLLRSCPKIGCIYVLVRAKKGKSVEERIKEIVEQPIYDQLKEKSPEALRKVKGVIGDVTQIGLGLSLQDRKTLTDTVNIVVHCAASIRFDDPLTDAIILNTRGTREVCRLVLEMKNLSVFVHVSTTYCNTDRSVIGEQLYPPHADWRQAIKIAENADRHTVDVLTAKYLGKLPNTYTFTKSMAEHVVNDLCGGKVPTVIFRPSIVISTIREPLVGWIDNFNGPVGLLVASGKGITKTVYASPDVVADYMPVDLAIKGLIISIWKKGTEKLVTEKLDVSFYNCSSYNQQHLTVSEMVFLGRALTWEVPLEDQIWYPVGGVTNSKFKFYIVYILFNLLPALIIDLILRIIGKKPMLLKIQRRIFIANLAVSYFLTKQWSFLNNKILAIEKSIPESDKEEFGYDAEKVDVYEYFKNAMIGGKMYLLKEDMSEEGLQKAKEHAARMWIIHCVTIFVFWFLLAAVIFFKIRNYVLNY